MLKKAEVATKVIIINKEKRVLVLERSVNDDYASGEYDLPGGRLDLGEDPLDGVKRELFEETGIIANIFLPIKTWSFNKNETQIIGITYITFLNKNINNIKLSEEHSSFKWLSFEQINECNLPICLENELILAFNFFEKNYVI